MSPQLQRFFRPLGAPRYASYATRAVVDAITSPILAWAVAVEVYAHTLKSWGMK